MQRHVSNNMKHLLSILFGFCVITCSAQWVPDSLLQGYSYRTVIQPDDYQGHVVSTIIRHDSVVPRHRGILYVHGFNDYFFQGQLGDSIVAHGWNFRAVDLRRYGRSLRPGMKRYDVRNLNEYFPDLDSAIVDMTNAGIDTVVIIGHSTGGLIVSLYMNETPPPSVTGLILNSPFLGWNMNGFTRKVLIPMVSCIGTRFPNISIKQDSSPYYAESLLDTYNGEWHFDTKLKLIHSPAVTSGWIHAIQSAQVYLHRHSCIMVPILLMHSSVSVDGKHAADGDAVLNVKDISKWGRKLGPMVTEATIPGGLHDLILSKPEVRAAVYATMFTWLDRIQ